MNTCKKKQQNEDNYFNLLYRLVKQYLKCFIFLICILFLIYIKKGITQNLNIGILFAYILLASLVLVIIYLIDNFVFNNLIIGIGIYFGFEILKFN